MDSCKDLAPAYGIYVYQDFKWIDLNFGIIPATMLNARAFAAVTHHIDAMRWMKYAHIIQMDFSIFVSMQLF